jgi:hypothetical protein
MTKENGPPAANTGEHHKVVEELMAAIHSEPVQGFLIALRDIQPAERKVILDKVLTGPPEMRIRLDLPPGVHIARRFAGGPASEFAISKRAASGSLITVFVSLEPAAEHGFHEVIPWQLSEN